MVKTGNLLNYIETEDRRKIEDLAALFANAGYDLFLVGGPVRDLILGREPKDFDFCSAATPDTVKKILEPVSDSLWLQGERFGTVGAEIGGLTVEITTFREEVYAPGDRKPEVTFGQDIEQDLARRDFTINAMAINMTTGEHVDPYSGFEATDLRLIIPVDRPHIVFSEDPLRMLRAFRFASQLGFKIPDEVLGAISKHRSLIKNVSHERIRDEISKLVLGKAPARALKLMDKTALLELVLPELTALKVEQDPVHKHKDIFLHTLAVLEQTPPILEVRLTAIFHDCAKPVTRRIDPEEGVSFLNHDKVGADMARKRLRALKYPNEVVDTVTEIIRLHHRSHTFKLGWTDSAVRRYVHEVGDLLPLLHSFVRADCTTKNAKRAQNLQALMNELEKRIIAVAESDSEAALRPELNGHEVMKLLELKPGREVGEAMNFLMDVRLDEGVIGKEAAIERLRTWAAEAGLL